MPMPPRLRRAPARHTEGESGAAIPCRSPRTCTTVRDSPGRVRNTKIGRNHDHNNVCTIGAGIGDPPRK